MLFKTFKKVDPQETTCGQFADWLRKALEAVKQDNGIEWCSPTGDWEESDFRYTVNSKITEDTKALWPVVFIQPGACEGDIITVAVSMEARKYDILCRIKVLAPEDTVWELGRACHKFLLNFLWSHEIPWVVGLLDKVPNRFKYRFERYRLVYREESLFLSSNGMEVLLEDSIPSEEVDAYKQDARRVLNNYGLTEVSA